MTTPITTANIRDSLIEPLALLSTLQMLSAEAGCNKTVQVNADHLATVLYLAIQKIEYAQQQLNILSLS